MGEMRDGKGRLNKNGKCDVMREGKERVSFSSDGEFWGWRARRQGQSLEVEISLRQSDAVTHCCLQANKRYEASYRPRGDFHRAVGLVTGFCDCDWRDWRNLDQLDSFIKIFEATHQDEDVSFRFVSMQPTPNNKDF